MSLIQPSLFPRSLMNMNEWFGTPSLVDPLSMSTLDLFDPFDQLDNLMARNMQWLNKPSLLEPAISIFNKYRVTVDCPGFTPECIKTNIDGNKLIVSGEMKEKQPNGDYMTREFKKTYDLPENSEANKMVSFMTLPGTLVIEVPLKGQLGGLGASVGGALEFPKVVDNPAGGGQLVKFECCLPKNIDPKNINVSVKDRDLIIRAGQKMTTDDGMSKISYYQRTRLPENTDFDSLICNLEQNKLLCSAPLSLKYKPTKVVPIQYKETAGITN
jgi:HSP20 family molecular chaperone IbpA